MARDAKYTQCMLIYSVKVRWLSAILAPERKAYVIIHKAFIVRLVERLTQTLPLHLTKPCSLACKRQGPRRVCPVL